MKCDAMGFSGFFIAGWQARLFEKPWQQRVEILAPVAPLMSTVSLHVGVLIPGFIQSLAETDIILVEKVAVANTDEIEFHAMIELSGKFLVKVLIDEGVFTLAFTIDSSREETHIAEPVRIVGRYVESVETSH